MGGIYVITMGKYFYIGRTSDFTKRKSKHLRDLEKGKHPNRRMQMTFSKHKREGFNFNIVFEIEDKGLLEITEQNLLNEFINYDNCMNYNPSASSCAMYGTDNYQARAIVQIDKNGKVIKEYSYIKEAAEYEPSAITACCKGKLKSHKGYFWMYREDYKEIGFIKDNYTNANLSHKKSVVQIDLKGNIIKIFNKIVDVEIDGFSSKNVSYACNGKRKSCGGYLWIYLADFQKEDFDIDNFVKSKINAKMLSKIIIKG